MKHKKGGTKRQNMDDKKPPAVRDIKAKKSVSSTEPGDEHDKAKHAAREAVVSTSETQSADEESSSKHPGGVKRSYKRKYVEKGSLTEATLIEEKMRARSTKNKHLTTEEDRIEERRAANRLSAFQSRQRRLDIIEELQV
jgi:hypothetical protein